MPDFIEISSKDNQLIKFVSLLQSSPKHRKEHNIFVLEGLRICDDAYQNNIRFDKLIVSETAFSKYSTSINQFVNSSDSCYMLKDELFKKICDTTSPQGIIALAKIPQKPTTIPCLGRYIALENIADPSNLGAIARTAEALGINGIILTRDSCDPYSPKSLRSSMGTLLRLPIYIVDNLIEFIDENDLRAFACVVDKDASQICCQEFKDGDVLIIGNEANGITETTKEKSFRCVTIKMQGKAESLNAAAAAAIAMWEMVREV